MCLIEGKESYYYDDHVWNRFGDELIQREMAEYSDFISVSTRRNAFTTIQQRKTVAKDIMNHNKAIVLGNSGSSLYSDRSIEISDISDMATIKVPVVFDPACKCPMFDKFLKDIMPDDYNREIIWRMIASIFDHWTNYSTMFFLYGSGSNGKTVLIKILTELFGPNNVEDKELIMLKENRFSVADLENKLANIAGEISATHLKETGIIKAIISGDRISAERKGKPSFNFINKAKLIFSCNEMPSSDDDTWGWYRKTVIIPFEQVFETDIYQEKKILRECTTPNELSGMLNKIIEVIKEMRKGNPFKPNRKSNLRMSNSVLAWFEECVIHREDGNGYITVAQAYHNYDLWSVVNGIKTISNIAFGRKMSQLGEKSSVVRFEEQTIRAFFGLEIKPYIQTKLSKLESELNDKT